MEVERNITIEREEDDWSAADHQSLYTTFIESASLMPRFTDEELNAGRKQIAQALKEIEAEAEKSRRKPKQPSSP